MYDVIIIGGGVVGCAVARELSKYQIKIALLEKTADISNGQSKANTGIIHSGYDAVPGTLKAKYNVLGNRMFDQICGELDVPYEWNHSLIVAFDEADTPKIDELLTRGRKNGVTGLGVIGHDEIMRREPNINPSCVAALLAETGGIVCPYALTIAYAENAASNGVEFFRNVQAQKIERENDSWKITTPVGAFNSKIIVNCAGIHSDEINNMVSENKVTIHPRRGEYYLVDKKFSNSFHASIFQVPTNMGKGILVSRTVDGPILVGPTAEDIDGKEETETTTQGLEKAMSGGRLTWPNLPTRAFITNFSGIRAHCDQGDFIVGEAEDAPNFFNAVGIESPGLTASPAIALTIAKAIAEKLNAKQNSVFQPIRKAIPRFRELDATSRAALIQENAEYASVVCRCETVTEAEIREAIRRPVGARTVDGIKRRTRAGMGRCQAGFCLPRTIDILCEELHITPEEVTKCGGESKYIVEPLFKEENR